MSKPDTVQVDARHFLDERGTAASLAPNGLNPANILEKAVKERVVESYFYKEQCFAVNEADVVDRVVAHVRYVGGTHGTGARPSPFLCLALRLLELAPSDDVLAEYLGRGGEHFKYLRALALFYVRLTRRAPDVYATLEPFFADGRKLRRRRRDGGVEVVHVDEFVDELLVRDRVCATSLWKMPRRETLEDLEVLPPRVSPLGDLEELLEEEEEEAEDGIRSRGESGETFSDRDGDDESRGSEGENS